MTQNQPIRNQQPLAELRHVYRSFLKDNEDIPVLKDINLSVQATDVLCLVGESGCGKTTTGKIRKNELRDRVRDRS